MMCTQQRQSTSICSSYAVLSFVFSVALMTAHVVIARLIVPWFTMVTSHICNGHSDSDQ